MLRNAASLSNYPTSTWAGLPAAASAQGQIVRVTDFGVAGVGLLVISDGTRWLPIGGQVLARSNASVAAPADTNEDILATINLPAGLMGLDGSVRVRAHFSYTNSANTKTLRARLGGAAGTVYNQIAATASTYAAFEIWISNRGAANSQLGAPNGISLFSSGGVAAVAVTSAVDTSAATTVVLTGQKALGTETVSLDRYIAEIWP